MARQKIYPITPLQLESSIRVLVETGIGQTGRQASVPKPAYFLNFKVRGLANVDSDTPRDAIHIADRFTELDMECVVHGTRFPATPRGLLNTSAEYAKTTCRFCEREWGVGKNFTTLGEIANLINAANDFDWILDTAALPSGEQYKNEIIRSHESIPLMCKRAKWGSSEPCGKKITHTWANISTALNQNPDHIRCQGECDSKNKGKARRKDSSDVEQELSDKRAWQWRLSDESGYRKASEPCWFTHVPCGQEVYRIFSQVVGYPELSGFPPETDEDCPYCKVNSPFDCLNQSIEHFSKWVSYVTKAKVKYVGKTFPKIEDRLALACHCGNEYSDYHLALQRNSYFGCQPCAEGAGKAQRAWRLFEAQDIVARRGLTLVGDPQSYTAPATICDPQGKCQPYSCILELVRDMPASAAGFLRRLIEDEPAIEPSRLGEVWSDTDIALLHEHASTKTYADIARMLGRTIGAVKMHFRIEGLRNDQRPHYGRSFAVKDDAFSELSPETCYWGGVLATDGCVTDRGEIKIELKAYDEVVIQALCQFVRSDQPLKYRSMKGVDGRGIYASLYFRSNQIRKDLLRHFGIQPRKTFELPAPALSQEWQAKSYMLGLIEGDGAISRSRRHGLKIEFISASRELFDWVHKYVELIIGKPVTTKERVRNEFGRPVWSLSVVGSSAETLKEALLSTYPGNMHRKWQK